MLVAFNGTIGYEKKVTISTVFLNPTYEFSSISAVTCRNLKKARQSDFLEVCLCWQTKPNQDKPANTKNLGQDQKNERF